VCVCTGRADDKGQPAGTFGGGGGDAREAAGSAGAGAWTVVCSGEVQQLFRGGQGAVGERGAPFP